MAAKWVPSDKNQHICAFSVRAVSDWLRSRDMESSGTLNLGQERANLAKLLTEKLSCHSYFKLTKH